MIILRYHEIFFRLTAPRCPGMAAGAVCLRKSHDIIILSFCNIVKGQAKYHFHLILSPLNFHKVKNDNVSSITVKCPNNFALKTAIR